MSRRVIGTKKVLVGISLLFFATSTLAQELLNDAPLEMVRPKSYPMPLESEPLPNVTPNSKVPKKKKSALPKETAKTRQPSAAADVNPFATKPVKTKPVEIKDGPQLPTLDDIEPYRPQRKAQVRKIEKRAPEPAMDKPAQRRPEVSNLPAKPVKVVMPLTPIGPVRKSDSSKNRRTASETPEPVPSIENQPKPSLSGRKKSLSNVRFGNIWAMKNGTKSGSFIASWDPVLFPYKRWNFGFTLGATKFERESLPSLPAEPFWVYEYGVTASYYLSRHLLPEVVLGQQIWNDVERTNNMLLAVNLNYVFKERPYRVIDRLYVGYANVSMDGGTTTVVRGGIGFRF